MSSSSDHYQVSEFTAIDLSQEMIMRAYELMYVPTSSSESSSTEAVTSSLEDAEQEENVYTDVVISDCTDYLLNRAAQGAASADLILAGDVLVYIGNLEPLFSSVKACLSGPAKDSGRFIFSVEKLIGEDVNGGFSLQESARFAHTKEYVENALSKVGMEVVSCTEHPLRYDGGNAVNGYVFVAQKL
jgi:predicted TPR repeat methyltransferase